jgi:hypothetical protein
MRPVTLYFYYVWALGWLLGLLTLAGRARLLVLTGVTSFLFLFGYTLLYLLLNVPWQAPLPVYLAHGLFPLFVISAVTGVLGGTAHCRSVSVSDHCDGCPTRW